LRKDKDEVIQTTSAPKRHYDWIRPNGMKFFVSRIARIERDAITVVDLVTAYAENLSSRKAALKAVSYISEVVWSIHDAVYMDYVIRDRLLSTSS
jgi:pyrroloquinoline-quinone synthase